LRSSKAALERRDTLNADYVRNDAAASSTATLTRARARLASSKAAIAEMQRRKMEGELVPLDQVEAAWASMIATARAKLLAIPAKCAARVGMCQTTAEVATILRQEVHAALDELSRSGQRGDGTASDPAAG
jgi:phage terminase Nu1 subunit (DNA packaging protein)